jgi:anti-sigma-K factor RskA
MTGPVPDSPQDLTAAYALGALSPEEARRFELFLASSPEARRLVAEYQEAAALMALGAADPADGPAPSLRDRVLARVAEEKHRTLPSPTPMAAPRQSSAVWVALAASLLLAVGLGAALASARGRLATLEADLANREAALAQTRQQLAGRQATLDAILEPGVQMFQLTSSGDPEPGIQLFWDRQRQLAIVHGFRLKPVPEGKGYQLWFIKDGAPVPSVTFRPGSGGGATVEAIPVPEGGAISAAAVTVEPEGGSAQPTSPIVMVGPLKRS